MSNIDGDTPEFDDLNLSDDEFDLSPADGMPDPTAQSPLDESALDEAAEAVEDDAGDKKSKKGKKAKKRKKAPKVKKPKKPKKEKAPRSSDSAGLLAEIARMNPYTTMLAISVLAIGIALLCLILEWNTYGFNRKPPKNLTFNRSIESVQIVNGYNCDSVRETLL